MPLDEPPQLGFEITGNSIFLVFMISLEIKYSVFLNNFLNVY